MRLLILLAASLALSTGARADAPSSGRYGNLTLAVTGNEVSGVFSEGRAGNGSEAAPQFSCQFLLRGRIEDGRGIVESWYPGEEPIRGNLSFEGGGVSLFLRENHGGCPMASGDMVREPYRAPRSLTGEGWTGVAMIAADRAAFRPSPGAPAPRTPYVVQGDAVAVLGRQGEWVRVSYVGGRRPVTGWLNAADLSATTPPSMKR